MGESQAVTPDIISFTLLDAPVGFRYAILKKSTTSEETLKLVSWPEDPRSIDQSVEISLVEEAAGIAPGSPKAQAILDAVKLKKRPIRTIIQKIGAVQGFILLASVSIGLLVYLGLRKK